MQQRSNMKAYIPLGKLSLWNHMKQEQLKNQLRGGAGSAAVTSCLKTRGPNTAQHSICYPMANCIITTKGHSCCLPPKNMSIEHIHIKAKDGFILSISEVTTNRQQTRNLDLLLQVDSVQGLE